MSLLEEVWLMSFIFLLCLTLAGILHPIGIYEEEAKGARALLPIGSTYIHNFNKHYSH